MNLPFMASGLGPALPEIVMAIGVLILVLVGAWRGERSNMLVGTGAFAVLVVALLAVALMPPGRASTLGGAYIADGFAKYMKALVILGSGATLALSSDYMARERFARFEFPILVLL